MQFIAALFEHFIVGTVTVFCFSLFFIKNASSADIVSIKGYLKDVDNSITVIALPISYLIGIYIDAISSLMLKIIPVGVNRLFDCFEPLTNHLKSFFTVITSSVHRIKPLFNIFEPVIDSIKSHIFNCNNYPKNIHNEILTGNSYKRTIEILKGEELQRYFLQLNSRLKVTRGVVPVLTISFFYSFLNYGLFDKYSLMFFLLSILSMSTYRWHYSLMETFKKNFESSNNLRSNSNQ